MPAMQFLCMHAGIFLCMCMHGLYQALAALETATGKETEHCQVIAVGQSAMSCCVFIDEEINDVL